jgi:hypothetical protein
MPSKEDIEKARSLNDYAKKMHDETIADIKKNGVPNKTINDMMKNLIYPRHPSYKPQKKEGGTISLKDCKVNTAEQKNPKHKHKF